MLAITSRPLEGELGRLQLVKGYRKLRDYPEATTIPGLLLYRFDANLIFFNFDYFASRLRQAVDDAKDPVEWVVLDASPINAIDGTALNGLLDLIEDLEEQGVSFYFARSKTGLRRFFSSEYSRELREKYPSRTFNSLSWCNFSATTSVLFYKMSFYVVRHLSERIETHRQVFVEIGMLSVIPLNYGEV